MTDDAELLRRFASLGDQEAFEEIVRRRIDLVYSVALRRVGGDTQDAEDVVQVVFRDLAHKAHALSRHPMLTGWLFTCTRYAAVQLRRGNQRRMAREFAHVQEQATDTPACPATPDESDWDRLRPVVDAILDSLGERDRQMLLWRFYEDRTFAEIAAGLSTSEDAARMRVRRALDKLGELLEKRGIRSSSAALAAALAGNAVAAAPIGLSARVAHASTAIGSALSPSAVTLMSTSKVAGVLAGLALAAVFGTAGFQYRAFLASRQAYENAASSEASALSRIHRLEGDLRAATLARSLVQAQMASAHSATAKAQAAAAAASRKRVAVSPPGLQRQSQAGRAFLDAHPEVEQALIARSRARAIARYGDLFAQLQMTPGQIRRFEDIIMQGEGFGAAPNLVFQVGPDHASRGEIDSQLQDFLGDSGYSAYQQYQQQMSAHQELGDLAAALYSTAAPLTAAQASQIQQAYAEAANSGATGAAARDALMAKAGAILTPDQFAALQGLLAWRQYNSLANQVMRQAAQAGGGS